MKARAPARYIAAQIAEIEGDVVLRLFAACVSLTYLLSAINWLRDGHPTLVAAGSDAVCWPFLESCRSWRWMGEGAVRVYTWGLAVASVGTAALFLGKRTTRWGYWLLVLCVLAKAYFMGLDYRTRLNQHYMAFWATFVLLLVPDKRDAVRLMIALFYVWAGTIKLNHEWLSGAALYGPLWWVSGPVIPWACAYVVVLEIALVWLLLGRRRFWFWSTVVQLLAFHLFSFALVGFFYPLLMTLLLTIFPLCWFAERGQESLWRRLVGGRLHPAIYGVAIATTLLQAIPLMYRGYAAITGEGRLFGLHMFDARVQCNGYARVGKPGQSPEVVHPASDVVRSTRMGCDPAVWIEFARNECLRSEGARLDLFLEARRSSDGHWQTVIDHQDVCSHPLQVNVLAPNSWRTK